MAGNTMKDMTTNFGKLDKFEGLEFRRCRKDGFLLTVEGGLFESLDSKYMAETGRTSKVLPMWLIEELQYAGGSRKGSKDHSQDQGFGYYNNGMFMLNLNKVSDDSDSVYMSSSSTVVNSSLWHARLGHVHYKRMLEMSKDDLIPAIDENPEKCTTLEGSRDHVDDNTHSAIVLRKFLINLMLKAMQSRMRFWKEALDDEMEVYMKQPEGFIMPGNKHKVCKLVKSLYGLKQAPKEWHQKFDEVVLLSGFLLNQSDKFSMKDMGEADVILGIKIKHCSLVSTPMDPVEKLKPNMGKPVDQLKYSRAIGCLMYAMTSTRPDIAYAVSRLTYLDASWINHVEDSSFTSGWVFLLRGGAISWASKKQKCITGSTMESEFVALAAAGKEAEWLRNLIHEILI
ncbi:zinc finger, CCHC-type containing protein [Tanacetum coccineum]